MYFKAVKEDKILKIFKILNKKNPNQQQPNKTKTSCWLEFMQHMIC